MQKGKELDAGIYVVRMKCSTHGCGQPLFSSHMNFFYNWTPLYSFLIKITTDGKRETNSLGASSNHSLPGENLAILDS